MLLLLLTKKLVAFCDRTFEGFGVLLAESKEGGRVLADERVESALVLCDEGEPEIVSKARASALKDESVPSARVDFALARSVSA